MNYLHAQAQQLRAALLPLVEYAEKKRSELDPADTRAAGQFRFIQKIEAALDATAAYFDGAEGLLNPPPCNTARIVAHLQQAHLQARLLQPIEIRQALASITAHHLPRPDFPDGLTR